MAIRTLTTEAPGNFVVVVPVLFFFNFVFLNFHLFYFYFLRRISFWFYAVVCCFFFSCFVVVLVLFWFLVCCFLVFFFVLFCFIFAICFDFCLSVLFISFLDRPHGLPGSWILDWGLNPDSPSGSAESSPLDCQGIPNPREFS